MAQQPPPKHLTISDAALVTGLSAKALRRRIERGTLSSISVNGRRWIPMEELLVQGLMVGLDGQQAGGEQGRRRKTGLTLADRVAALERRLAVAETELASRAELIESQRAKIDDLDLRVGAFEARFGRQV